MSLSEIGNAVERFCVRSARVAAGAAIALGWLLWPASNALTRASLPISQLTLLDLAAIVGVAAMGLLFLPLAWMLAFGEGPPPFDPRKPQDFSQ